MPGSGGYSAEKPIVLPKGTVIDRAHPLRVTLMGDSVLYGAGPGGTFIRRLFDPFVCPEVIFPGECYIGIVEGSRCDICLVAVRLAQDSEGGAVLANDIEIAVIVRLRLGIVYVV